MNDPISFLAARDCLNRMMAAFSRYQSSMTNGKPSLQALDSFTMAGQRLRSEMDDLEVAVSRLEARVATSDGINWRAIAERVLRERDELVREAHRSASSSETADARCEHLETDRNNLALRVDSLTAEASLARKVLADAKAEIECRISHGADSNGHLEGVLALIRRWEEPDRADIVERLVIPWEAMTDMGNGERAEAAAEIVRLRDELSALKKRGGMRGVRFGDRDA